MSAEMHVWRVPLAQSVRRSDELWQYLSPEEWARAAALRETKQRLRFVTAHGAVREILAHYIGVPPDQIMIAQGSRGKPYVVSACNIHDIRFNLSHSDDLALCAVTAGREVGVDVERMRMLSEPEQVARRFFAPAEIAALAALPRALRVPAFFACWTRKEAYIKALGEGLSLPLHSFAVSVTPGDSSRLLWVRGKPAEPSNWSLPALTIDPGYVAAVAARGRDWQLSLYTWPDAVCHRYGIWGNQMAP